MGRFGISFTTTINHYFFSTTAALEIQQDLLQTETGQTDGYVNEELAECLLALGRANEAKEYFAKAHTLLSQDAGFAKNETQRLARLEHLSQ